tara:strand:- start:139 stop:840 length:702 start_codon:yes stop_codon:yes gene_type:complete
MKGPKSDDIFDVLSKVDSLNLYDDPQSDIYNKGATQELYKLLLTQASSLNDVEAEVIEEAMDQIAWHESRGRSGATQKSHKFDSQGNKMKDAQGNYIFIDGPGRGLYQYEVKSAGGSGAGVDAMVRLYNRLGGKIAYTDQSGTDIPGENAPNIPEFMDPYLKERWGSRRRPQEVDFAQLSELEQKVLFLADKLEQDIDFSDIGTDTAQWWLDHHKKAPGTTDPFDESMKSYKP